MPISSIQISEIKKIIQAFIDDNSFYDLEDHVQASYTIPILKILGWTPTNWKINTPQEIKTGKRPDILFKGSGGGTISVIESKGPNESLDGKYQTKSFTKQLCDYIGAEGVSWGVLTNFLEWRIYNPHSFSLNQSAFKYLQIIKDKKIFCTDNQLEDFFSLLEYRFLNNVKGKISKDAIYYPRQDEIREEFFQNLKEWRSDLRNYLFKEYKGLSTEEIDNQTQRILDRLIFIEVCFDKGIIHQDYLGAILFSEKSFYRELKVKFRLLDEKFNSEIFAKADCDDFDIEDNILKEILKGISRIDFSQLSVHIIGEVYENYLGELLKAGKNKITTAESKEQLKRKSQGIYYTPDYIVNYIVKNTVGELLNKCKTEKDVEKIKVIDPACGSGSFLIRAFEEFYQAYKRVRNKKQLDLFHELNVKKQILLHNLFGVDLN